MGARKAAPGHQNKSQAAGGRDYGWALHYGSINFPLAALIAASVRVAAPSLRRELSVWKIDRAFGEPENLRDRNASMMG